MEELFFVEELFLWRNFFVEELGENMSCATVDIAAKNGDKWVIKCEQSFALKESRV